MKALNPQELHSPFSSLGFGRALEYPPVPVWSAGRWCPSSGCMDCRVVVSWLPMSGRIDRWLWEGVYQFVAECDRISEHGPALWLFGNSTHRLKVIPQDKENAGSIPVEAHISLISLSTTLADYIRFLKKKGCLLKHVYPLSTRIIAKTLFI